MLQESLDPEGPRVPTSIQSTWDFDKIQDTTLMRMYFDHESPEFSDLGSRISDLGSQVLGSQGHGSQGLGSQVLRSEGPCYLSLRLILNIELWNRVQGPCRGLGAWRDRYIMAWPVMARHGPSYMYPPWYTLPAPPWYHPGYTTPGTPGHAGRLHGLALVVSPE